MFYNQMYLETQQAKDYEDLAHRLAKNQTILRRLLLDVLLEDDDLSDAFMATASDFVLNQPLRIKGLAGQLTGNASFLRRAEYLHYEFWQLVERAAQKAIAEYLIDQGEFWSRGDERYEEDLEQVAA